jgi:uncharacterized membrane protein
MVIAALNDDTYNAVLLVHIISFLVAAAPAVINPIMGAQYGADGPAAAGRFAELAHRNSQRVHLPALVVLGATGVVLLVLSDGAFDFGDTWVSLAFLFWLGIGGMVTALIMPGSKKLAAGDPSGRRQVQVGSQVNALLLVVILYLMVFQPGA